MAVDAVDCWAKVVAAAPGPMSQLGPRQNADCVNEWMRSGARQAFAAMEGFSVHDLDGDLLSLEFASDEGNVIVRFNKNGHDRATRGNGTNRWDEYERHSLFGPVTHVIVGYQVDPVSGKAAFLTVTCPVPGGNFWSYYVRLDRKGQLAPTNVEGPLDGMPPVTIRSLKPKKSERLPQGQGA